MILAALITSAFGSERPLSEKLIGKWEFQYEDITRKESLQRDLQMACVEEIQAEKKTEKECVALIRVVSFLPNSGTVDIFLHLEIQSKGEWALGGNELTIKTVDQKMEIKKSQLHINGQDVSNLPEMADFNQGLSKEVKESMKNETTKRKIVSINEKELVYVLDLSGNETKITAKKK